MRGQTRVVITGLGVVCAAGWDLDTVWERLLAGGDGAVPPFLDGFPERDFFDQTDIRRTAHFARLSVAAAVQALRDAGLPEGPPTDVASERAAVIVGSGYGSPEIIETQALKLHTRGPQHVHPLVISLGMPNAPASAISRRFGWTGQSENVSSACATGASAIGSAARLVNHGYADRVLAGGGDGGRTEIIAHGLRRLGVISKSGRMRPFDTHRDGFLAAEGAGIVVLESLDVARARGAHIYGEILGYAGGADASGLTAPEGEGAIRCINQALANAGVATTSITHFHAHGTATELNDIAEAAAFRAVSPHAPPLTTGIKGVVGHSGGGAGAIQTIAVALTIQHGLIPPTAGCTEPDPALGLDVVVGSPRRWTPGNVLSMSLGLGGHNAALVIGPPPSQQ